MTRPTTTQIAVLVALLITCPALAATGTARGAAGASDTIGTPGATRAPKATPSRTATGVPKMPRPARVVSGAKATPSAVTPRAGSSRAGAAGARRLDEIHIEGEIPVPQVLFITARDQRRFMEFHHRRYLKTSRELGEATVFPDRIAVVRSDAGPEPR